MVAWQATFGVAKLDSRRGGVPIITSTWVFFTSTWVLRCAGRLRVRVGSAFAVTLRTQDRLPGRGAMSVPLLCPHVGRLLTVLEAEHLDQDETEQYPYLAARGILRMASAIDRM
jgi:hypothetical protein